MTQLREEFYFTKGRVIVRGKTVKRGEAKKADYKPSLIVFVVFPWFSEKVTNLNDCNKIFYRSFCRRFFCQYAKETSSAKTILKYFQGNETVAEVTDKLAGVLILKDNSITSSNLEALNVEGLAYHNPNAAHKVSGHFRCHLSSLGFAVDDFEHDNY